MLQRRTLQQFHRDEGRSAVFVNVVDRANVRMIERRSGLRLAAESFERCFVLYYLARQEFQRHLPAQLRVFCAIHHAHSATADFFDDAVMRDDLPSWKV